MGMVAAGTALCVSGNHEAKLLRAHAGLEGARSRTGSPSRSGSSRTSRTSSAPSALSFLDGLISHFVLDDGKLVVAHAGLKEAYHGRSSGRVRAFALYGDTSGETDEYGLPVRYPWAQRLPRPGHGRLRPHPGARGGVGQQHDLPRHRRRLRRVADGPALPRARARLGARQSGSGTSRPARSSPPTPNRDASVFRIDDVAGTPLARDHPRRQGEDPRGERRSSPRGDEPLRRGPALAGLPPAHHVAGRDVDGSTGSSSTPSRPSTSTPAGASLASSARRSTWVRGRSPSSRGTRASRTTLRSRRRLHRCRSTPAPADRSSPTPTRVGRPARGPRHAALRVARHRLAGARLRAAAVVGQGAGPHHVAVRLGGCRGSAGAARGVGGAGGRGRLAASTSATCRPGCGAGSPTPGRSGMRMRRTSVRPTSWTGSRWRRSRSSPRRAASSP